MKAYFDNVRKDVPENIHDIFLEKEGTAVITIDMHEGHLSTDPDCPCPSPRGRQIIEPLNKFMEEARALNIPIIHVRSVLRKGGVDEKLNPSAWRLVFPITVGEIPNIAEHAIEGTKWNKFSIDVHDEDLIVSTKKRLSAFYPTDLEMLLRNMGIKRIVLTGCMTDCCVLNTAFDGANRDFRIVVPRDLTRGSEHLEEAALRIISLHLGLVVDSAELLEDWKDQNADIVVNRIISHVRPGDIILLHDIFKSSVEAALKTIDILQDKGYQFVTVDKLNNSTIK